MVALKASAGTITIPLHLALGPMSGATVPSGDVEILVNQQPATQLRLGLPQPQALIPPQPKASES
jgi:hypothetical protein